MRDAVRLAFGTLTILPVRPPARLDRTTAGGAMVLAPLVGLLLGVVGAVAVALLDDGSPLLVAALVVALLALLTRGIHLDGLADTADGLGSGARPEEALAIMRRSDIGPFGVVTLVLTLIVQVAALAQLVPGVDGAVALTVALVISRLVLPMLCTARVPAARTDGLGSVVARSVGRVGLLVAVLLSAAAGLLAVGLGRAGVDALHLAGMVLLPLLVAGLLCRRCVRRFGGVTGDVLGACVEAAFTTALVVACL